MVNNTRRRDGEAGQSLVLVALGLVVLIGVLGLAIDVGYYRYVTRELQTAADAAALAGAMDVTYADVVTAAQAASAENGFTNGANNVAVQVNCASCGSPITGTFAGTGYPTYVQATVTQSNQPQFFSKILGIHPYTLSASAVAAGGINCIYALDTASGGAISLNVAVVDSTCGVVDNSNISGLLGVLCAPSIQLKGSDNVFIGETCGSGFRNTAPVKITTAVADPLAGVTAPFVSNPPATCTTNTNVDTVAANNTAITQLPKYCYGTVINNKTGITISPGTYWGGGTNPAFKITNSTVTFLPGTYNIISQVVGQPGIQMTSTIFNTNQVSFGSGTYTVAGGITDNGAFGSAVNWNNSAGSAALFIIDGGGLKLTGSQSNGTGSIGTSSGGVTFYNTGTAGTGAVTSYGTITNFFDFSGFCGGSCQLSAPTTGTYAGILFFEDRANTATTSCGFGGTAAACFTADSNYSGTKISNAGAYYFANSTVDFDFDFGYGAPYSLLVAKDINWFFSFTLNNNFANLPNGSPVRQGAAVLVQ